MAYDAGTANTLADQLLQQLKQDPKFWNPMYFQQVLGPAAMKPGILPWVQEPKSPQEIEQMLKQDLMPRPGETRQAFFQRVKTKYPGSWHAFANIAENGDWEGKGNKSFNDLFDTGQPTANDQLGSEVTQGQRDLIAYLSKPLFDAQGNPTDPKAAAIMQSVGFNTMRNASLGSRAGGLSGASTQRALAGAALELEQQRISNLNNALSGGSSRDLGLQNVGLAQAQQNENKYQFDVGQQYKQFQQNQQQQAAQNAMPLGLLGAGAAVATGNPQYAGQAYNFAAGLGASNTMAYGSQWTPPPRF